MLHARIGFLGSRIARRASDGSDAGPPAGWSGGGKCDLLVIGVRLLNEWCRSQVSPRISSVEAHIVPYKIFRRILVAEIERC
jgi:hypothetical protein